MDVSAFWTHLWYQMYWDDDKVKLSATQNEENSV